jgi:hypothetical protein
MKQELKQLLKNEINVLQAERKLIIYDIIYNEERCDKANTGCMSTFHFEELNKAKNYLRKIEKKLKKYREIQSIVKNINTYLIDNHIIVGTIIPS